MRRTMFGLAVALMLAAAACGSSAATGVPSGSAPATSSTPSTAAPTSSATSPAATSTIAPQTPSPTTSTAPLDPATPNLAAIKPCTLFPTSDADTVSAVQYLPGKPSTAAAGRTCAYADLSAHDSVAFDVQVNASPIAAQQAYAAAAAKAGSFTVTQVSGLGDGAFIARVDELGIQSTTIYVLTGYYLIAISTISNAPGPTDKTLETESAAIVGRLR